MIRREEYLTELQRCISCSPFFDCDEVINLAIVSVIEDAMRAGMKLSGEELLPWHTEHKERMYMIQ